LVVRQKHPAAAPLQQDCSHPAAEGRVIRAAMTGRRHAALLPLKMIHYRTAREMDFLICYF
jgi:hypothetical protein